MSDEINEPKRPLIKSLITIGSVLMMILLLLIPLPALLLDILWGLNLVFVLLILGIKLHSKKVSESSLLPTGLLLSTVIGLLTQISFGRLILTKGEAFDGRIIRLFSSFAAGSGGIKALIMSFVFFIAINLFLALVFIKGAARVAEVAARFTLDALPFKQTGIDEEHNSGTITEREAVAKKDALQRESDFYGALDGASKFISGNFKFSLFITAISIIGGIFIGTSLNGETIYGAMMTYVPLSLANGFIAQFLCFMQLIPGAIVIGRL